MVLQDTLEFKKKQRVIKVRMLDGSVKSLVIDDSHNVEQLMVTICFKIGKFCLIAFFISEHEFVLFLFIYIGYMPSIAIQVFQPYIYSTARSESSELQNLCRNTAERLPEKSL